MTNSINEAFRLYNAKNYSEALSLLLSIPVAETGRNPNLAYLIGLCFARMEKYEDAIIYLEQVVTMNANFARIYQCRLALAVLYALTERTRLADFELKKLAEFGYESPQIFSTLGFIAHDLGNADESLKWYEKALEMDEKSATALNGLGYVLADAEIDLPRALSLCKEALAQNPENPAYLDSLAWAHYKLGQGKEARAYIMRAQEKLPGNKTIKEHFRKISML